MTSPSRKGNSADQPYDLFVIGGGINGCGIARDAAGRGLKVGLAEMNDLASAASSSSTKLFHGGLRYLEYFEFRLVREALIEREVLLRNMPHISWPMRFVLPYHSEMRFESTTPLSRLLGALLPWLKGRRPSWLIRLGLFLYDHLGGRKILPATRVVNLNQDQTGTPLNDHFHHAFEYSDCWVEDSRLVVLNARDAHLRGADIMTRTKVISAKRQHGLWQIEAKVGDGKKPLYFYAKAMVNAAGPWVENIISQSTNPSPKGQLRLVRGSHIITKKLFDHDHAYFLQGNDGRIIFAIPYEQDFTLIGTTDVDHPNAGEKPVCSEEEQTYLCDFASQYFKTPIRQTDIVATFSGLRPLYNDGTGQASAATRDYVLKLDQENGAPLLNVFGGKITTYRKLAETVLQKLAPFYEGLGKSWTAEAPLPGGDFPHDGVDDLIDQIHQQHPYLPEGLARRMARAYGTDTFTILDGKADVADLGEDFGHGVFAAELNWVMDHEWVMTVEDFIWRRTKLGLFLSLDAVKKIAAYIHAYQTHG